MTTDQLLLFIFLAFVAEVLGTTGGFGSSLFFVPIAGYFLDFHSVLGVTALFHVSSNLSKIVLFKQGIDKKLIIRMGIPAVVFVIAGAVLSRYVASGILEVVLAIFLMALSGFLLWNRDAALAPTSANSVAGGALSGFLAGLLGTGGAVRGVTLAAFALKKEVFIATSAFIDLAVDASRSVVYAANGYVHHHDLYLVGILLVVSFAGTYVGKALLRKISEKQFRAVVLALIFITGLITLGRVVR